MTVPKSLVLRDLIARCVTLICIFTASTVGFGVQLGTQEVASRFTFNVRIHSPKEACPIDDTTARAGMVAYNARPGEPRSASKLNLSLFPKSVFSLRLVLLLLRVF